MWQKGKGLGEKKSVYIAETKRVFFPGRLNFYIISEWNGKVWKAKMLLNSCITCMQ